MVKVVDHSNWCCVCLFLTLLFATQIETGPNNLHIRYAQDLSRHNDLFFEILEPPELVYTYQLRPAKDFGATFNESFRFEKARLVPAKPIFCCTVPKNAEDLKGNVVLITRGECSFKKKTNVAEQCGAKAVIITDLLHPHSDYFVEMVDDNNNNDEPNIPAAYLMGKSGHIIRQTLYRLNRNYALINFPLNLTFVNRFDFNLPPWLLRY